MIATKRHKRREEDIRSAVSPRCPDPEGVKENSWGLSEAQRSDTPGKLEKVFAP
jgi:hypothetical protein